MQYLRLFPWIGSFAAFIVMHISWRYIEDDVSNAPSLAMTIAIVSSGFRINETKLHNFSDSALNFNRKQRSADRETGLSSKKLK